MEETKRNDTLRKLKVLADRGFEGEKENAQKILARLLEKYDIDPCVLDDELIEEHKFHSAGGLEKQLLIQVCFKVTNGDREIYTYKSGNGARSTVCCKCTKKQAAEIAFEFDFYRELWNDELQIFFKSFIIKHQIYDDKPGDAPPPSPEEVRRVRNMMMAMLDKSPTLRIDKT